MGQGKEESAGKEVPFSLFESFSSFIETPEGAEAWSKVKEGWGKEREAVKRSWDQMGERLKEEQ